MTKILVLFLITFSAFGADLTISVKNIKSEEGSILVAVWNDQKAFPNDYNKVVTRELVKTEKDLKVKILDLEKGDYAIAIFHDLNENYKLDTNKLGMPTEAFGFSNNPKILFGPPNFKKAKIKLSKDMDIQIKLIHL